MIKAGKLKYLFPEDQDSPSQAYTRRDENEDNG